MILYRPTTLRLIEWGVDNARPENAALENDGPYSRGWKMPDLENERPN